MQQKKRLNRRNSLGFFYHRILIAWIALSLILLPMSAYAEEESYVYSKNILNETNNLGRFGQVIPILLGKELISQNPAKTDKEADDLNSEPEGVKKLEQRTSLKNPFSIIPFVSANPGQGCCANLDIIDKKDERYYCSDAVTKPEENECCPSGGYTTSPYRPGNQADCNASYFMDNCTDSPA